ncbi:MAG: hypothetical protein KC931_16510, partial [Candidatus Omnitrophica bacterium]|nr:hypothetical protein [Candidatus Omnitrophota bacterium]
ELKARHQESVLLFDAVKRRKEDSDKASLKLERLLRQKGELQPSEFDGEELKRNRQIKSDVLQEKIDRAEEIRDQISRLQEELETVEGEIEVVQKDIEVIDANYRSISDRENLAKKLEEDIAECRSVETVTAEDVDKAKKGCDDLIQQISSTDSLNEKIQQFKALLYCRKEVRVCEEKAKSLRQAGKDAEGVLTETIKELGSEIEVQFDREGNPRLMVHSEDRSRLIFFFDLSKGQKLAYTLPIAINAVGRGGVFTFPQESWEGLDGVNRSMVVRMCCENGVIAVTGECDEEGGNLRAEVITTENIQESTGAAGGEA